MLSSPVARSEAVSLYQCQDSLVIDAAVAGSRQSRKDSSQSRGSRLTTTLGRRKSLLSQGRADYQQPFTYGDEFAAVPGSIVCCRMR